MVTLSYRTRGPQIVDKHFVLGDNGEYVLQYRVKDASIRPGRATPQARPKPQQTSALVPVSEAKRMSRCSGCEAGCKSCGKQKLMVLRDPVLSRPTTRATVRRSDALKLLNRPCS